MVIFHRIWPALLSGAFAGVDDFSVISGFVIVGLLVRENEASGRISNMPFRRRGRMQALMGRLFSLLQPLRDAGIRVVVVMGILYLDFAARKLSAGTFAPPLARMLQL